MHISSEFRAQLVRLILLFLLAFCISGRGAALADDYAPFYVDQGDPTVAILDGRIDPRAALSFRRLLSAHPSVRTLVLNSGGGLVQIALVIAEDVYSHALSTVVPSGSQCFSACSLIFLAGSARTVAGQLGVHQIYNGDVQGTQVTISDIIESLSKFGTPLEVVTRMMRTPPDQIYVFSQEEIRRFGIERHTAVSPPPVRPQAMQGRRLAVYQGLDLYGSDIASLTRRSLDECASACLSEWGSRCRAFTFNADPRAARGPNCFIKSDSGMPDGNRFATSGLILAAGETPPGSIQVGAIDPHSSLHRGYDLPGMDLSHRPYRAASSLEQCRVACVARADCQAFTFVSTLSHCWLKFGVSAAVLRDRMTSGIKQTMSFSPLDILPID